MLKFGTDGVRGRALTELTPELVLAFGRAAARILPASRFVVGRDTRASRGLLLEGALVAGLTSEGASVELLGVVPTPAVAWLSARDGIAGAVISASHNPYYDNGVKLFGPGGLKLTDEVEAALEAELHSMLQQEVPRRADVGTVTDGSDDVAAWMESVIASTDGRRLDGLRVVVDCANGSAAEVGPRVLRALGADVAVLHADPDGRNINAHSGLNAPGRSAAHRGGARCRRRHRVRRRRRSGAGRRRVRAGSSTATRSWPSRPSTGSGGGALVDDTVVVTVMTNLGFRLGMEEHGIDVVEVPVGDRHVLAMLQQRGLSLGGEQSGHVIFTDLATTGDGLLTAAQLLDVVAHSGRPLGELADAAMTRLPQVLRNVAVPGAGRDVAAELSGEVAAAEAELGSHGRVLLRPSGTEPLVRVMVEAPTLEQAEAVADRLATAVGDLH